MKTFVVQMEKVRTDRAMFVTGAESPEEEAIKKANTASVYLDWAYNKVEFKVIDIRMEKGGSYDDAK